MAVYENWADMAGKISWKGGALEFVTGYGFKNSDIPTDTPDDVENALVELNRLTDRIAHYEMIIDDAIAEYAS